MKVETRERDGEVTKVRIFIGEQRFDITEHFGKLDILASGRLKVLPGVANVIQLEADPD
jgi:hypothetical protein